MLAKFIDCMLFLSGSALVKLSQGGHNLGSCISEWPGPLSQGRIPGMPDRCGIYVLQDPEIQAGFTAAAQHDLILII